MDLNIVVVCGRLAAPTEIRVFDSGTRLARFLLTVRADAPRSRVDVLPVTLWDPPDDLVDSPPEPGDGLWISGSIQRRFWDGPDGRRSRLEIVANHVAPRLPEAVAGARGG